ncbi:MAG: carbohydrate kinase family protein [Methanomassiliicoccales archaeon]|nr:MAG: carbohydrate kinase family protein [Methanomassiliicoccales archaeon]
MRSLRYNPLTRATFHIREPHYLAVIGHLAIDTIYHPNFTIDSSPGGSAAAIATASVQLGIGTSIHSKVGRDFPRDWLAVLENLGVDTSDVEVSDKKKNLHVEIKYDDKGNLEDIKCNDRVSDELGVEGLANYEAIHICPAKPENQQKLILDLKDRCDTLSISFSEFFLDDYAKKNYFDSVDWKNLHIVFLNEKEAFATTQEKNPEDTAYKFHDEGVDCVVITLGKKGSLVFNGSEIHRINAREVVVIDPTGCGDSYIGGFLGEYLATKDIKKAASMGTYMASLTAQKKGAWAALLSDAGIRF